MKNIFFTADIHLGHENIIKYCNRDFCLSDFEIATIKEIKANGDYRELRGFKLSKETLEEMEKVIIDNINSRVSLNDDLYVIGDFGFAKKTFNHEESFADLERQRTRIKCKNVHLILGNHDRLKKREYLKFFKTVSIRKTLKISRDFSKELQLPFHISKIVMDHFPAISWDSSGHGSIMLHGHCHGSLEPWKQEHMKNIPLIDVGIDNFNYYPVSIQEISQIVMNIKDIKRTPDIVDLI